MDRLLLAGTNGRRQRTQMHLFRISFGAVPKINVDRIKARDEHYKSQTLEEEGKKVDKFKPRKISLWKKFHF